MSASTYIQENNFIDQLGQRLSEGHGWEIEKEWDNGLMDLVVKTQDGKRMFIEFKQAGNYGELPLSTVLSMNRQRKRLSGKDAICLVSFSKIPVMLKETLDEMGILAIENPSVEDAVGKISQVMTVGPGA